MRGRLISAALLAILFLVLVTPAFAISESPTDLPGLRVGGKVEVSEINNEVHRYIADGIYEYIGNFNVAVNGSVKGQTMCLNKTTYDAGVNVIRYDLIRDWTEALNGNYDFVMTHLRDYWIRLKAGSWAAYRIPLRGLAELCGMHYNNDIPWNRGVMAVDCQATEKPFAYLGVPVLAEPGREISISFSGTSFVRSMNHPEWVNFLSYTLKADGKILKSGSVNKQQITDTYTYKIPASASDGEKITFTLEVKDGVWRSTTITKTLTVKRGAPPPPEPPEPPEQPEPPEPPEPPEYDPDAEFSVSPSRADEGEEVRITDSSRHPGAPDQYIVDWEWDIEGIGEKNGRGPWTVSWDTAGRYRIKLTVTDDCGNTDSETKWVTVNPVGPVADFEISNVNPLETEEVTFTDKSYCELPGREIVEWNWDIEDIGQKEGAGPWTVAWNKAGIYSVRLTVKDNLGREDSVTKRVEVGPNLPVASFNASKWDPLEEEEIQLTDQSFHPAAPALNIVRWIWKIQREDGSYATYSYESPSPVTCSWDKEGTYSITLTVRDQNGNTNTDTNTVTVKPRPPEAKITVPGQIIVGREAAISADESVAYGGRTISLTQNRWEIYRPNGSLKWSGVQQYPANPAPPNQMFDSPGIWKIRVQVVDSGGNVSEWITATIDVLEDKPPVADFWVADSAVRNSVGSYSLTVQDMSAVPQPDASLAEGDRIAMREWTLYYDKNNNGSFGDSGDEVIRPGDAGRSAKIIQTSNNDPQPKLEFYQTGRYKLELKVTEEWFGWGEWRTGLVGSTSDKALNKKVILVGNVAPIAGFQITPQVEADIVIVVDGIDNKTSRMRLLESNLSNFIGKLISNNIDPKVKLEVKSPYQTFGIDNQRTSTSSYTAVPGSLKWRYQVGDAIRDIAVAVDYDGTIYFGSYDSYFYALNPNGTLKWRYKTGGVVESAPTITPDGRVIFGSCDGALYCLTKSGSFLWKYQTGNTTYGIHSSPAVADDGTIYVGSFDGYIYALNPNGTLKWQYYTGGYIESSVAVGPDGAVYVGGREQPYLYALNADGTLRWKFQMGQGLANNSCASIGFDGTVYVGSQDGYLYAINPNGTLKWKVSSPVSSSAFTSPAIGHDGTIYAGYGIRTQGKGGLLAVRPNGTVKWNFTADDQPYPLPTIDASGVILFGTFGKHVYAVNPDGTLKWSYNIGITCANTPSIAPDGTIYIGANDGYLYAFGMAGAPEQSGNSLLQYLYYSSTTTMQWRENAVRFVVSVTDSSYLDYDSQKTIFVSEMEKRSVYLCAITGSDPVVKAQTEELTSLLLGERFDATPDYADSLYELADFIIAKVTEQRPMCNVILLGEGVSFTPFYTDSEGDTKAADEWYYEHDPTTIYELSLSNSMGLDMEYHQKSTPPVPLLTRPSKVGTYTVKYRAQDQPPNSPYWSDPDAGRKWSQWTEAKIYVHRRPVAAFTVSADNPHVRQAVVFTDQSYDPDLQFTDPLGLKGIRNREWRYRTAGGSWVISSQPPDHFTESGVYEVALRVQDFLGAWSDWAYQTINVQNRPPEANFRKPSYVSKGQQVTLYDLSSDPDGDSIVAWEWTVASKEAVSVPGRITKVWFRGNTESGYDYGYLYGWNGSSWVLMAKQSGSSFSCTVDASSYGNITKLKVRVTTDGSVLRNPTYAEAYQAVVEGQTVLVSGLYLTASSHNADIWSGEWFKEVEKIETLEKKYYTKDITVTWPFTGTYRVTLRVQDEHGLWSQPFSQDITVSEPNRPPTCSIAPATGYLDEPLVLHGTASDPDPGDYVAKAYWWYKKPGGDWVGPFTQFRGDSDFLTFTIRPDVIGDWQFKLVVEDSRYTQSEAAYRAILVQEGFEVDCYVTPPTAERGRRITIVAFAKRPLGAKIQIDRMQVVVPDETRPNGQPALASGSPHVANMAWNGSTLTYSYSYLIPDRTKRGYWPDDGSYYVEIRGTKGEITKTKKILLTVKGHILNRTQIRTYQW